MDKKNATDMGFFDSISESIKEGIERRKNDTGSIIRDAVIFAVSFLFARCHVIFGTYPLAISFISVLESGVWTALLGSIIGALSLGKRGAIFAVINVITIVLRIITSGGKNGDRQLFSEPLVLRICAAAVGSFIGAVYELLLKGFNLESVLYGLFGVLLSAIFTFSFAGISDAGVSFDAFVFGRRNIFEKRERENERFSMYLFEGALLLFVFFISLSLKEFDILGISPAYMFSTFATLFFARRFGPIRGMTVGFVSSLGISALYSVSFALLGIVSGLLFSFNIVYAVLAGGALLSLWGFYSGGVSGFLLVFPEYASMTLISLPILRKLKRADGTVAESDSISDASNMVATTALGYKNSEKREISKLENAMMSISVALRSYGMGEGEVALDEYRDLVIDSVRAFCKDCPRYDICISENPAPYVENSEKIATKLYKKQRIFPDDGTVVPPYCKNSAGLFESISGSAAHLEEARFKDRRMEMYAEECELFSKLINEAEAQRERECSVDSELSEKLQEVFSSSGIVGGVIRAYGERHKYFIGAGEDKDGRLITSPKLRRDIERAAGVRLGVAEYYRKGDIALFECPASPLYTVEFASSGYSQDNGEVSGDTAVSFDGGDGYFYSLISDGMGSGDTAHKTSLFTADFLSRILSSSCSKSTALHLLNHIIRGKGDECSATVDLFEFDLYSGEAVFYKCGAAPSYVKREGSIFRIRSETAPIGLMKSIDAEKIRVEIKPGDYIIMLSDGVSQSPEDSVWLLELLSRTPKSDIRAYAELILEEAKKNSKSLDDMSVAVARVVKAEKKEDCA